MLFKVLILTTAGHKKIGGPMDLMMRLLGSNTLGSRIFSDMNQMVDPSWNRGRSNNIPVCNVIETPTCYHVCCELPGCTKESICCEFKDNTLSICAERAENPIDCNPSTNIVRKERYCGKLRRQFELPHDVDSDRCSCEFVNGVLECTLPKKANSGAKVLQITVPTAQVSKK